MNMDIKKQLAHILWIGGATDSGKSTVAQNLALRWDVSVYHYDRHDAQQMEQLAKTIPEVDRFLKAALEERWIQQSPELMFDFLLLTFQHRFQLLLNELLDLPSNKPLIVEGFGLLPELIHPQLSSPYQAIWFIPTDEFKWESMLRRGKPSFASAVSNPEKARMNLFTRDMMLAEYYRRQVALYNYTLLEVNGSQSAEKMTDLAEAHFTKYPVTLV